MWIHIPSHSVADMAASSWDLEQLSQELESSATWKTKSLKAKSWRNVLKTESLTTVLSGLIYDPSMRQLGVERFISSLEGSPASLIALRERSEERTTQENSQEKYSVLPTNLGDQLSFLRMFQESDDSTGTTSDQDYKRWDTELRKSSLQREKQGHHIKGSDYSSWPTPDTQNFRDGSKLRKGSYMNHSISLHHKVAYWRTVTAQETEGGVTDFNKKVGQGGLQLQHKLRDQVAYWPTASQRDYKGSPGTTEFKNGRFIRTSDTTGTQYGATLDAAASQWPTVTAQEFPHLDMELNEKNRREPKKGKTDHSMNLQDTSRTWSTPSARDYRGTVDPPGKKNTYKDPDMYLSIHPDPTTTKDGHTCSPTCRRLNPRFAEWLMGLPRGWTSSSAQLEMELFQLQQLELSFYLASVLNE